MAGKEITWNEVSSFTIPELVIGQVWRGIVGDVQGQHIKIPGRAGGWYVPQPRGMRTITADCYLQVTDIDQRENAIQELSDWLDVESEAKLRTSDRTGVFYLGALLTPSQPDEWRHLAQFQLQWMVQPYSYDEAVSFEAWSFTGDDGEHTHAFNPGITLPVYPVVTITPTNGSMYGFVLESDSTYLLVQDINISSGQSITVNSLVPVVVSGTGYDTELTGAFDPLLLQMQGVRGEFPLLIPGVNNIHFRAPEGTATSYNLRIDYRKTSRR